MRVFILSEDTLCVEAIVAGYDTSDAAIAAANKSMLDDGYHQNFVSRLQWKAEEVVQPTIIWRELEQDPT